MTINIPSNDATILAIAAGHGAEAGYAFKPPQGQEPGELIFSTLDCLRSVTVGMGKDNKTGKISPRILVETHDGASLRVNAASLRSFIEDAIHKNILPAKANTSLERVQNAKNDIDSLQKDIDADAAESGNEVTKIFTKKKSPMVDIDQVRSLHQMKVAENPPFTVIEFVSGDILAVLNHSLGQTLNYLFHHPGRGFEKAQELSKIDLMSVLLGVHERALEALSRMRPDDAAEVPPGQRTTVSPIFTGAQSTAPLETQPTPQAPGRWDRFTAGIKHFIHS